MRIVAELRETPDGEAALQHAVQQARSHAAELVLVGFAPTVGSDAVAERDAVLQRGEAIAAPLRDDGLQIRVVVPSGVGRHSEAILHAANDVGAELIVIGLRQRSRVGKLVFGSETQEVLLAAGAEVLVVKQQVPS